MLRVPSVVWKVLAALYVAVLTLVLLVVSL